MRIFALIPPFLQLTLTGIVSASVFTPPRNQQILQVGVGVTEANVRHLLAAHDNDPVEVIRLLDPVYAAILDEPRFVEVIGTEPVWMTEGDKLRLKKQGLSFMDLTAHENTLFRSTFYSNTDIEWPDLRHQERVHEVIKDLDVEEMAHNLGNLTTFYNRYYRSQYGAQSSRWIYNKVLEIIADAPPNVHLSLETFTHEFPQISVIVRFEPSRRSRHHAIKMPVIIIGSHLDSANYDFPFLPAPGADDGGSGTVTILEAFRALVQAGFRPKVPVEFHWYAAEEGGLLGSQDIVSEYVHQRKNIRAMIQFDMTAYVHKDTTPAMTYITNNVDTPLTDWTMKLATEYSSSPVTGAKLFPGGVSDHLSWHRAGVPVVCATESDPVRTPNPYIHTVDDRTVVKEGEFSFSYALEFAKVAVGFAAELGGWDD
ncbi:Zn-dependent exopeptidase [Imleria badia]|nr:Zn-dependent exopeptidase [Imleria badia]